jgi:hypothetical protein
MQVKGTSIRNIFTGVEAAFGASAVERVRAALPPSIRGQIEPMVLAGNNYPVEISAALHDVIRSVLGGGSLVANRRVGAEAARVDFGGIYRVFIRVADYETLLRGLSRAWRQYNSQGEVRWSHIGSGEARGEVVGVDGFTEPMWHSIAGRLETILVLGGARKATVAVGAWSSRDAELAPKWS